MSGDFIFAHMLMGHSRSAVVRNLMQRGSQWAKELGRIESCPKHRADSSVDTESLGDLSSAIVGTTKRYFHISNMTCHRPHFFSLP